MPKKLERCVRKVRKNSPDVNPWAVCSKSTGYKKAKGGKWVKRKKKRSK